MKLLLALIAFAFAAETMPPVVSQALIMANRKAAAASIEAEAQTTADANQLAVLLLYAGELRRLNGEPALARKHFERVAGDFPSSPARNPAKLGLAVLDANGAASGNTLATLELIGDSGVPDTLNADRYLLILQEAAARATPAELTALAKKARAYAAGDKEVARRIQKATERWIGEVPPPVPTGPKAPPDLAAIESMRRDLAAGELAEAGEAARKFLESFPDSPFAREAGYAVRRADKGVKSDPKRVAVLLPLTGDYAIPAGNLRHAITLANEVGGNRATLVFKDTAGKPEQCVAMLEAAVIDEGAAIVIGPLRKEEALTCAPAAQALHVPMLTLSSAVELAAVGDQVFRPFPATEELVEGLLDEVYDRRGLHQYAVLHPKTAYGENAARAFAAAVTRRGGTVLASIGYDPEATDFRSVAKQLGQKDYKARASEFASLKAQASARGGDPSKVVLPPQVDFEAIFIPDSYQRVALLASSLAFEEFAVGSFRPRVGDMPIQLCGLNAWNNDDLARRGGNYVLGSIFVDAFDARAKDSATAQFVDRWRDDAPADPSVVEAVGYDTMGLVLAAIAAGGDPGTALLAARLENGVAGTRGFAADRHADRSWRLLTVTRSGIASLEEAEAPPPPDE